VISAMAGDGFAAWAMKRLPGQAEPAQRTENILLVALVCAAILGQRAFWPPASGSIGASLRSRMDWLLSTRTSCRAYRCAATSWERSAPRLTKWARTRRRLEAEVRREDRARTIGGLVGRIAHEMRNPLNSIRLSLQMLAQRQEGKRLHAVDFQMAIGEVDRMNGLLSDLLAFQQPRPPKMELRRVGPILENCVQFAKPQAGKQEVDVVLAGDLSQDTLLDEQYFRQIMLNLILNAIDASQGGQQVLVTATAVNGSIAIEVSDRGPGLTTEQQEHLFEPFYTTKTLGTD